MKRAALILVSGLTVLMWSTRGHSQAGSGGANWLLTVTSLTSPALIGSGQPQLSAIGNRVVLSWVERSGDKATLRFSDRTDTGWTEAQTVASGTDWFVNWADVPSVIPLQHESMAAHWLQKSAASTYAYDVRLAFSRDRRQVDLFFPACLGRIDRLMAELAFVVERADHPKLINYAKRFSFALGGGELALTIEK